jgi:hypothetical protein
MNSTPPGPRLLPGCVRAMIRRPRGSWVRQDFSDERRNLQATSRSSKNYRARNDLVPLSACESGPCAA